MNELIKITNYNGKEVVSAKLLHEFLEIETRFDTWIKRMFEYGFTENIDYSMYVFENQSPKMNTENQYITFDIALTLDCAKEISMIQRSEKGKQARLYFIECEKKLKEVKSTHEIPKTFSQALMLAAKQQEIIEKQLLELKEAAPKLETYNNISNAENLLTLNDAAKSLQVGRNSMMKLLREKNILRSNNTPYQNFIDSGYFVVKIKSIKISENRNYAQTFVSGKGLIYLDKILNN